MSEVELIYNNTTQFYEVEELDRTRGITATKAVEVVAELLAILETEVGGPKPEPACILTWRRLLKLSAYAPAAQAEVEAGILPFIASLIDGAHSENLVTPPYSAEATTLMLTLAYVLADAMRPIQRVAHLRCFNTPSFQNCFVRLMRLVVSRGHFPVLVPMLRLFTILYDTFTDVRRVARDKDVPATLAALQESVDTVLPKPVSEATLGLLKTMQQWLPRHKARVKKAWERDTEGSASLAKATAAFTAAASAAAAAEAAAGDSVDGGEFAGGDASGMAFFTKTARSVFDPKITRPPLGAGMRFDAATAVDIMTGDSLVLPTPRTTIFGTVYSRGNVPVSGSTARSIFSEASSLKGSAVLTPPPDSGGATGGAGVSSSRGVGGGDGTARSGGAGTYRSTAEGLGSAMQQASQLAAMIGYDRLAEAEARRPKRPITSPTPLPTAPVGTVEEALAIAAATGAPSGRAGATSARASSGLDYSGSVVAMDSTGGFSVHSGGRAAAGATGSSVSGWGSPPGTGGPLSPSTFTPRSVSAIFASTGGGDAVDRIMMSGDRSGGSAAAGAAAPRTPAGMSASMAAAAYGPSSDAVPSASMMEAPSFAQSMASHSSPRMPILQAQVAAAQAASNQAYSYATRSGEKLSIGGSPRAGTASGAGVRR